jgi:predicted oxidoreductase
VPDELTDDKIEGGKKALRAAYEAGYNFFDHADIYGGGTCEKIHGLLFKEEPSLREETVLATKVGIRFPDDPEPGAPQRYDFSRDHIIESCEKSLQRLNTDYIDLYQLHRPDYLMDPEEVDEAFGLLHRHGKVRYFGVSNFAPSKLKLLQQYASFPLLVNQVEIHLGRLDTLMDPDGTLNQCMAEGITPLAWSPIGGGVFGEGGEAPEDKPHLKECLHLMDELAKEYGVTRTEIALAWLLQHPSQIIPIVGSSTPERIKQATKALDIELSREHWYQLMVAARGERLP